MAKQQTQQENISIELDGEIYNGHRIITGVIKPRQKIYFINESILDNYEYDPWKFKNPRKVMENRAKHLLRELVFKYLENRN